VNALCLGIGATLAAVAAFGADGAGDAPVLTPGDIRRTGIVDLLDRPIRLTAPVQWEYPSVKIPEDPRPMDEIARQAGAAQSPLSRAESVGLSDMRHDQATS